VPSISFKGAVKAPDMKPGDILEVIGDCPTIKKDMRMWCEMIKKVCLSVKEEGSGKKRIQIQF